MIQRFGSIGPELAVCDRVDTAAAEHGDGQIAAKQIRECGVQHVQAAGIGAERGQHQAPGAESKARAPLDVAVAVNSFDTNSS